MEMGITETDLQASEGNLYSRLIELERTVRALERQQLEVNQLSSLSSDLGLVKAGEIRAPKSGSDVEPGEGFSGVRISGDPMEYDESNYNIVGVNNDALQVGISADDGKLYAAGGALVIDQDALSLEGLLYGLLHTAEYTGVQRILRLGMVLPEGATTPAGELSFTSEASTNLVSNGDFETGTFSSWTKTTETNGAWSVVTSPIRTGSYAAEFDSSGTGDTGVLTSARISVTAGVTYNFTGYSYRGGTGYGTRKVEIKWYDATSGGSLLRTDTMTLPGVINTWSYSSGIYTAPASALSCAIVITVSNSQGGLGKEAFDDFSLSSISVATKLQFRPHLSVVGGVLQVQEQSAVPTVDSGFGAYYFDTSGVPKAKNDTGTVINLATYVATIEEQQTSGTAGGSFTSGADRTRTLNTETDPDGIVTISSNQFTLGPGTYLIEWETPAYRVDEHQSLLYSVTGGAVIKRGAVGYSNSGNNNAISKSNGAHALTLTGSTTYEIRHRCTTTRATDGLGLPGSFGTEIYTRVVITKYQ
jgi:hypothetical protein